MRNQPVLHEELKKRHGIFLTDTAWYFICEQAELKGVSASEYVEAVIQRIRKEAIQP